MTTPTDTRPNLLTVIASMHAAAGKEAELRATLEGIMVSSRQEEGCVNYDLHQGVEDPGSFFFYENWESIAQHDAHLAAPHLIAFRVALDELLDRNGLNFTRLHRIA